MLLAAILSRVGKKMLGELAQKLPGSFPNGAVWGRFPCTLYSSQFVVSQD